MSYFVSWFLVHVTPFVAFATGVWISIRLRLSTLTASTVWLMAIPVALLTIGNFMNITFVEAPVLQDTEHREVTSQFTYTKSVGNFLVFMETLVFYGTAVPKLFDGFRSRVAG